MKGDVVGQVALIVFLIIGLASVAFALITGRVQQWPRKSIERKEHPFYFWVMIIFWVVALAVATRWILTKMPY